MASRREIIKSTAIGLPAVILTSQANSALSPQSTERKQRLTKPEGRRIRAAFMVGTWANLIDIAGPWETFANVSIKGEGQFDLYTVAAKDEVIRSTGGMMIKPHFTIENALAPDLIVSPAHGRTPETLDWLRRFSPQSEMTMSVCTGAFALAEAGLLDGMQATTFHKRWDRFARMFPDVQLVRGPRFVDNGHIATAGGLTSGIDLALHIVDRYFGRVVAQATADNLEYRSEDWKV